MILFAAQAKTGCQTDAGATHAARQRLLLNQLLYRSWGFMGSLSLPPCGGPLLRWLSVCIPPSGPRVVRNPERERAGLARVDGAPGKTEDVFLYCAFADKKVGGGEDESPSVVVGEVVQVCLVFENPFHVPLSIECLSLSTGAAADEDQEMAFGESLRLIPTCIELPPAQASTAQAHAQCGHDRTPLPAAKNQDGGFVVGEGRCHAFLNAVVVASGNGGGGSRGSESAGQAHGWLCRLKGCRVRLWNVIYDIEACGPAVPSKRVGGGGGRAFGAAGTRANVESCGDVVEPAKTPLYHTLWRLVLATLRACPLELPDDVLAGQVVRCTLLLENTGAVPISVCRIVPFFAFAEAPGAADGGGLERSRAEGDVRNVVVCDTSTLLAALPLAPGMQASVHVWICPPEPWCGKRLASSGTGGREMRVGVQILYGENDKDHYWRCSEWSSTTMVMPGLSLSALCVERGWCGCAHSAVREPQELARLELSGAEILPRFVRNENYGYAEAAEEVVMVHALASPPATSSASDAYANAAVEESWAAAEESTLSLTLTNHTTQPISVLSCGRGGAVVEARSTAQVRMRFERFELATNDNEESVPLDWQPDVGCRALVSCLSGCMCERARRLARAYYSCVCVCVNPGVSMKTSALHGAPPLTVLSYLCW